MPHYAESTIDSAEFESELARMTFHYVFECLNAIPAPALLANTGVFFLG